MKNKIVVLGAGGFIGSHMVKALKLKGYYVIGTDLKYPDFDNTYADEFIIGDLRNFDHCKSIIAKTDKYVFQFAADMGGAGYIFTGDHDADVMHNSAQINLNVAKAASECRKLGKLIRVFYSSSACIYPQENQIDPNNPNCEESSAYPANPDSEYGWEKLFSERLYSSYDRLGLLEARIIRYHNIFGPYGTYDGGKEKAPAAMCRKAILADNILEVWGPGTQTRTFLYIDECIRASLDVMFNENIEPYEVYNIGSEELISINDLAKMAISLENRHITIKNISGPIGVNGRRSDNTMFEQKFGYSPGETITLKDGMTRTFDWIKSEINSNINI